MKLPKLSLVMLALSIFFVSTTNAASKLTLIVDGKTANVSPQSFDGTTYVPLRAAAELLGAGVQYIKEAKTAIITASDYKSTGTTAIENKSTMTLIVNGTISKTAPKVVNGTTYVPVRAAAEMLGADVVYEPKKYTVTVTKGKKTYDTTIMFPVDKYPETATHIKSAIAKGKPAICTIDRDGADENREKSLAGIPTKEGYDRDEWPMAMCAEGGAGADVAYVESSDNRGSGSWVGNQLDKYPDGTRVLFIVSETTDTVQTIPVTAEPTKPAKGGTTNENVVYESCKAAREAGVTPLHIGDPGYSTKLDRDRDGVACE